MEYLEHSNLPGSPLVNTNCLYNCHQKLDKEYKEEHEEVEWAITPVQRKKSEQKKN